MAEESSDDSSQSRILDSGSQPRIVIIGAGISGIQAANDLIRTGFTNLVILEATKRSGGRIHTIDLEHAPGKKAELGANWIHGVDLNPIYKLAMANKLLSNRYQGRKLGQKVMFLLEDGKPLNTKIVEEVDWAYGMLMSECEDFYQSQIPTPMENDSVGAFVEREFEQRMHKYQGNEFHLRKMVLTQRLLGECIIAGCHDMSEVSLSEVGAFQELPGVHYVIPPGFETVVDILKQPIPKEKIHYEHVVSQISWENEVDNEHAAKGNNANMQATCCVECQNGKKFYADHVLVTVSLGYLKKHSGRLFNPPLPEFKMDAIHKIEIGTVNKVVLEFDDQILPDEVLRLELVWDRENIENEELSESWVKKIGSFEAVADNVLMGWLSGREAEYMETLDEEEIGARCVDAITRFLGKVRPIPKLKRVVKSCWRSNPYTLGAYAFIPINGHIEDIETLGEPVTDKHDRPVLLFAGEATHSTFYSSSHGALLSGQREAQRIIDLYSQ